MWNGSKWYVLSTVAQNETEVVSGIKKQIPENLYEDIFVLKYENVWKKQGKSLIDIEAMFDGCVFVRTKQADKFVEAIKELPDIASCLLQSVNRGEPLYEMSEEEVSFLKSLLGGNEQGDYVVHRSFVRREEGKIAKAAGPLTHYIKNICLADYKHRRVVIEQPLFGQVMRVKLCIMTEEDCVNEGRMVPEILE